MNLSSPASRRVPLSLTVGGALLYWPGTAGSIRVPFEHGVTIPRWRVHFRNINPREGRPDQASFRLSSIAIGKSAGDGTWLDGPTIISVSLRGLPKKTAWQHIPLEAGTEYLLSYSWTADSPTRRVVGGGWAASHPTDPDAELSPTQIHPVDAWIEAEVPVSVPVFAVFGDSLSSGVTSTVPVRDSWPSIYGRRVGALPIHYTASGDTMKGWANPEHFKWTRWSALTRPDFLIHAMGFNDIGNNAEIWELQSRHLASLENIRRNATSDIRFATITPSGAASPKQLQTRRSYNAWLTQKNPQVIPFHHVVSEDDLSLRAEFDTDSTHMNTSGYMAMAHAVPTYGLSPGLQREYSTPDREGLEPVHLTRPLGNRTETITSRSSRIPFQLPRRTARWRVVLINQNLRSNQAYKGQVRIRFLGYAPQKLGPDGELTSSTISEPAPIASDLMIPDISEGWASPWVDEPLEAGTPYLLTLGYQTSGSETTLSMGGGWWTLYKPANAALAEDPTAQPTKRQPFDIRIEVVPESTNAQPSATDLVIGDSISAGSDASFPILEAPAAIANRDNHRYTRLNTHGGTSIGEWIGPEWGNPYSRKWHDITRYGRADRVIIALGNNDIHAGYSIERIKAAMQELIRYARSRISDQVTLCTVTPRTKWQGTPLEDRRKELNSWLRSLPGGANACVDLALAVESSSGDSPAPHLTVEDGIHFNSVGNRSLSSRLSG